MKAKEKVKIILAILIISIILTIYAVYCINNKTSVYATSTATPNVKISNAPKVDIDTIIQENSKELEDTIITEIVEVEYITQYKNNKDLPKGAIQVAQEGATGLMQVTIKRTYTEDGQANDEQLNSIITKAPINKIVEIGTSNNKKASKIAKGSYVYVTSDRANIMYEADTQSEKITTVQKNTELKVQEVKDEWCKINIKGQTGWVKLENLTSTNPNPIISNQTGNTSTQKLSFDMDLTKPSGLSIEQFKKVLTDSRDKNNIFSENAEYFYYIEKQYNINGIFVAAIGINESAWGTSRIALNKKNLFGYGAYDSSPYSSAYSFETYSEGIDLVARVLVKNYLNPKGTAIYGGETATGKYYNGNTVTGVNQKYATDKGWATNVYKYMEYLYKKL